MSESKQFPSIIKMQFIPNIEITGAKEGFLTIRLVNKNGRKDSEALYNNKGRFILPHSEGIVVKTSDGEKVPYKVYRDNMEAYPNLKNNKFGTPIGFVTLRDFDHGHDVTLFFSGDSKNPKKLGYFAENFTDEVIKSGVNDQNKEVMVFEIGKVKSKAGDKGKWYIKFLGTKDEVLLLENPAAYSEAKKEVMIKTQAPPPPSPVQDFVLNDSEKVILGKIDDLAKVGNPASTTRDKIRVTLIKGFGEHKTGEARASYIAQNAEKYLKVMKVEG